MISPATLAAIRLHDFIKANAGESADWPLQITSTDPRVLERLGELLRDLGEEIRKREMEVHCPTK